MKRPTAQFIGDATLYTGDCLQVLKRLPAGSVRTCVTSPPYYGLRDYGHSGQIGLEESPTAYVKRLVRVFRQVRRVLTNDGTLWLNIGDSYASKPNGSIGATTLKGGNSQAEFRRTNALRKNKRLPSGLKHKDLFGIPWTLAFALRAEGWYLRADIIWHKPNSMPESVTDRPTKAHEYIFLLSKSEQYYYNGNAIKEPAVNDEKAGSRYSFRRKNSVRGQILTPFSNNGSHRSDRSDVRYCGPTRNRRSVWTVSTKPFREAHFATFPVNVVEPCILAGSTTSDLVLDPFMGSGTTGIAAKIHNRRFVGIDLNPNYVDMAARRIANTKVQESLFAAFSFIEGAQ